MFERFTDQARRVVVLAQEEARMLGHGYIGTEHILLGLLSEGEGPAAQALGSLGITLDAAREQVTVIIGEGSGQPGGHIPFTSRSKKVLELSLREAQRLGDSCIGTEHILLGLAREGEGVGAQVLDRLGASTDKVLAQVLATVRAGPGEEPRQAAAARTMGGRRTQTVLHPGAVREILSRLDEISERLAAVESHLAGRRGPGPGRASGAAPSSTATGREEPAASGQDPPATGREEPAASGEVSPPPVGEDDPGQPPAAQQ